MCGICGIVHADPARTVDAARVGSMNAALVHRGPDDEGAWVRGAVGLAARRLSIRDVVHGHQPMANENASCVVVFNGEIYNADELRADLQKKGFAFRTQCDTEVVLRAYEAWDEGAVHRFNGMFAFAVWDAARDRLYAARDRVGIKPLYFTERGGTLAFSSELASLLRSGLVDGALDPAAIDAYLTYLYVPHPESIFRGVRQLGPGESLTWHRGRARIDTYWRPEFRATRSWTLDSAAETYKELLRDAVRLQCVSDVPLGAFLSGGIDSTSVVAVLAESSPMPVKTFTIGFDDAESDERGYARMAANAFATRHIERVMQPDLAEMSAELVRHFGEPFADSSAIPTWMVSKLAREEVTVALSGDGGDELFAGYTWLHMALRAGRFASVPRPLRAMLDVGLKLAPRSPWWDKARRFSADAALTPMERLQRRETCFNAEQRADVYSPAVAKAVHARGLDRFREYWEQCSAFTDEDRMLSQDLRMYLPDDILTKVDRMSMAASLEARVPLLDHRIVEFAATVPFEMKYNGVESKRLVKHALKGVVPAKLLEQRKRGFAIPVHAWLRGELAPLFEEAVLGAGARSAEWFEPAAMRSLFAAHRAGRENLGHHLWALLVFEQWLRWMETVPGMKVRL